MYLRMPLLAACLAWFPPPAGAADLRFVEPDAATGSSMAVVVSPGPLAHTAQMLPVDGNGQLVGKGQAAAQVEKVFENMATALKAAGTGFDRAVKLNVYVAKAEVVAEVQKSMARKFAGEVKPAVSFVVTKLPHPDALVAMDAVAVTLADVRGRANSQVAILPPGPRVYVAGQAEKGDLAEATRQTMVSLRNTLHHLGLGDEHIVQLKAFVKPMESAKVVREELAKFFGSRPVPPLVLVEWISTLPIEIELIAAGAPARTVGKELVEFITPPGMTASPVYSRVAMVNHGPLVYVSGLYGPAGTSGEAQVQDVFATLDRVLKAAGSDFKHLAKATYYVSTDDASRKLNELRPRYYDPEATARRVEGDGQGRGDGGTIHYDRHDRGSVSRREALKRMLIVISGLALTGVLMAADPPFYPDKTRLLVWRDDAGKEHAIAKPADWPKRRAHVLANMQLVMGPLLDAAKKVPLDVRVTEEVKTDQYARHKLTFAVEADDRAHAYLFIPHAPKGKLPAVLCLHPTSRDLGKGVPAGFGDKPDRHYAVHLAERGYVTLAPDYVNSGDYKFDPYKNGYASATMKGIWNHMRSVDLLQSLPEVDPERIGVVGHSLGGHNSMFVAAFDERIKCVVSNCGFCSFPRYYGGNLAGWSHDGYMPRIRSVYQLKPEKMPFDFTEVVAALAPRPFLASAPVKDHNFDVQGVKDCIAAAKPVYELLGAGEKLAANFPDCGHDFPDDARAVAYAWLDRWLKAK